MVVNCVAYGCKNVYNKNPDIHFHTFPFKRPEILNLWIQEIRRENWEPSRTSRLCSQHFTENNYQVKPGSNKKVLKLDAVPSIFNYPAHLKKRVVQRRILDRNNENQMEVPLQEKEIMDNKCTLQHKDAETQTTRSYDGDIQSRNMRRTIKTLKQKVRRKDTKINSMKHLMEMLEKNLCTTDNLTAIMENYFQGFPLELLTHQFRNENSAPNQRRYTDLMKQFAHTLYFYSPKAYSFVRQYFILPNPRTIRKWIASIDCYPGFLTEVLEFLKLKVKELPFLANCALIMDAMSIRKQIIWDNVVGKFVGTIDCGGITTEPESPASEALFFQIVSYAGKFKCPVGYFLIDKTDANVQKQLLTCCLRNLYEIGIVIRSITSDGTATNLKTFQYLGCNLTIPDNEPDSLPLQSYFSHPCAANVKVYCILDPCHMIKLARNCMAEKSLVSEAGAISWKFVENLHNIQTEQELRLANRLSVSHINYKNKVMNVKLATQALSSSVADALNFLKNEGYSNFQGCAATVEFIYTIDKVFDILNARNPFGKNYKSPIRPVSLHFIQDTFNRAITYLRSLKIDGVSLVMHGRKTFAVGLIISMSSIVALAQDLFILEQNSLNYFLPYKCSQDHLEIFFSCIRGRGGWNNNPNVMQLRWALRQLLLRNTVKCSISANCVDFEETNDILSFDIASQNRNEEVDKSSIQL